MKKAEIERLILEEGLTITDVIDVVIELNGLVGVGLTEVALGSMCEPKTRGSFPRKGFDSTWVDAGTCGVINHEAIVYDAAQINLKYLCEFSKAQI